MPAVERSRAHEQAARMLADRDADPVAVAAHLLVSRAGPGRLGVRRAARAPRAAPRRSATPPAAVRYLERAVAERPEPATSSPRSCSSSASRPPTPATPTPASTSSAPPRRAGPTRLRALHWTAVLHLVAGARARQPTCSRPRSPTCHEEDEAAKPLLETLIAAGLESATRAPAARRPLRPPRGAARRAADRLRALRADHARVRLGGGARGRARAPTSSSTGRSRSRSTATTSPSCARASAGR